MKKLHRAFNVFSCFQTRKKGATEPNSLSHFKACEKETQPGLNSLSCFQAHEKETQPGLFFNLRLRKASKPLRERV